MLTDFLDVHSAANAVNEAGVFRLLVKPCKKSVLTEAITTAMASYRERAEERIRIELPIRLCRAARGLKLQSAHTVDISKSGARFAGLEEQLELGEVLKVECADREAPFRAVWMGARGTASEGQAGLECLATNADLWTLDLRQLEDGKPLMRARAVQRGLLPQEKPPLVACRSEFVTADAAGGSEYFHWMGRALAE